MREHAANRINILPVLILINMLNRSNYKSLKSSLESEHPNFDCIETQRRAAATTSVYAIFMNEIQSPSKTAIIRTSIRTAKGSLTGAIDILISASKKYPSIKVIR